ncbi:putative tricarboxylic transport membrane protein [Piscibacillus halophilus]|uniref:Putative tricarboxylic transport membrane protein n=1 Tax=Piscibacillus halophilus TaxID=571933 RepID=A0A1H9FVQ4_9BACI|nr:tripartite tricarboxylate transporter TctB family protein [Piscibacillus halophilus]SEQ41964.1 putative tricarboxylic transport membrane protein [Piscibacillus halophilus]
MVRLAMPLFFIITSIVYLILTFDLTKSRTGDPNAPLYFPAIIGIFLLIMGIIYFFQEWKKRSEAVEEFKGLIQGRTPVLIISSLVLIFIYTFLFERIGFLFSTMIFLGGLLFVVNGIQKWLQNILISVIFSFVTWYSFSELLNVSLP